MSSSIARTKNFLVRNMSRNAAQNGLSDQAMPMLPVTRVISVSEWPRFLNIVPATQIDHRERDTFGEIRGRYPQSRMADAFGGSVHGAQSYFTGRCCREAKMPENPGYSRKPP